METTDYCDYKLSLALKAAGFDEPCRCCYVVDKDTESNIKFAEYTSRNRWNSVGVGGSKYPYKHISAPTLWHAQKWLREKKKMHCQVLLNGVRSMFFWQVREMIGNGRYVDSNHQYDVYEDAMSDCISAALELIKKGE